MTFEPYVSKDMIFNEFTFDFLIANEIAKAWYGSKNQSIIQELQWSARKLTKGMTVIDCGAHHGLMTLILAKIVGPSGRVVSYEILPANSLIIEKNVSLNKLENVTVRPVGLSDRNTTSRIHVNDGNAMVDVSDNVEAHENENTAKLVRLDDDIPVDTRVDFLKIDVEGNDLPALRGMARIISQHPLMNLELHNFSFKDRQLTLRHIFDILDPLGYSWELQPEPPLGLSFPIRGLDVQKIAEYENPHLFGTPAGG